MAHYRKQVISILTTNRCNMRCGYCYTGNSTNHHDAPRVVDLRFAKKGIDDFFTQFDSRAIRFFAAGEPTLEMGVIKEIKSFAESKADGKLIIELQTNGLFSPHTAAWIADNVDIVWISYDGTPEFQDLFRRTVKDKPTAKLVEKNIRFLLKHGRGIIGVRSTIVPQSTNRQVEIVEYLHRLGIRLLMVDPMFEPIHHKVTGFNSGSFFVEPMDFAQSFLVAWERAKELGIFYGSILTCNFDEPTHYACRACLPCPHLTVNGYVSACDMADSGETPLKELIYGVYDPVNNIISYDQQKIAMIRERSAQNLIECQRCEVLYNCAGGCVGESLNETGSIFRVKKDYCDAIRFLARHMPLNSGLYPYLHP